MVARREFVAAGLMGGVGAAVGNAEPAAETPQPGTGFDPQVAARLVDIRNELRQARSCEAGCSSVDQLRTHMRTFLKTTNKFPDYIDVGVNVWTDVYDWHVKYQQALNVTRQADGRYVLAFMFTLLVLRPDQSDTYVGQPYDKG